MSAKTNKSVSGFAIFLALVNLLLFGAMFALMHYYELLGVDVAYFDEGTRHNVEIINSILGLFGQHIELGETNKISTLAYGICLGLVFLSSAITIIIANKKSAEECETTKVLS